MENNLNLVILDRLGQRYNTRPSRFLGIGDDDPYLAYQLDLCALFAGAAEDEKQRQEAKWMAQERNQDNNPVKLRSSDIPKSDEQFASIWTLPGANIVVEKS